MSSKSQHSKYINTINFILILSHSIAIKLRQKHQDKIKSYVKIFFALFSTHSFILYSFFFFSSFHPLLVIFFYSLSPIISLSFRLFSLERNQNIYGLMIFLLSPSRHPSTKNVCTNFSLYLLKMSFELRCVIKIQ